MTAPRVLIADNDPAVSSLLGDVLRRVGLDVEHAYDGEAARGMAQDPRLCAMVCDLDMPRLSGIEVLEWLAAASKSPPVVVVSGYLDDAMSKRLRALPSVRSILRKPFDLLGFAELVRSIAFAGKNDGPAVQSPPPLDGTAER